MTYNIIWEWDTARVYGIQNRNVCIKIFNDKSNYNIKEEIFNFYKISSLLDIFTEYFPNHNLRIPKIIWTWSNYILLERVHGYTINSAIILKELFFKNIEYTEEKTDYALLKDALKLYGNDRVKLHKKITSHYMEYYYNNLVITNSWLFDFHRHLSKNWIIAIDFSPKNIMIIDLSVLLIFDFWK